VAQKIVDVAIQHPFPTETLLNVNVPMLPENQIKAFRTTRQGLRVYRDRLDKRIDPRGRPYYWIGGDTPTGIPEEGSDIWALCEGFVSITPLQLDLTAYNAIQGIGKWLLNVNNMITNQLLPVNHSLLER
jgi:5'-nucleotidase